MNNANSALQNGGLNISAITSPASKVMVLEMRNQVWSDFGSPWWCSAMGNCWGFDQAYAGHVKAMLPNQTVANGFNGWDYTSDVLAPYPMNNGVGESNDWVFGMQMITNAFPM
jgi:hypothetical protein